MAITPDQARAELARRGLSVSSAPATPSITSEQAKAELDRRTTIGQDYPIRRTLSKYLIRPAIEGGAMTIGGLAGTALAGGNPLGGVALGGVMYPPAHQAANAVDTLMGIGGWPRPVGTIPEQIGKTVNDVTTGLGMEAGGKALGLLPSAAKATLRGAIPTFLGPSREAVAARMANPEVIANAPSYLQQAESLPPALKGISKAIDGLYNRAKGVLRSSPDPKKGAVPLSFVNKMIGGLQDQLKVGEATVGSADQAATGKLSSLIDDMNSIVKQPKMPEIVGPTGQPLALKPKEVYLPETTVHKLIQRIRKNIDFTDKSASSTNSVLTDVSGQLDAGLKSGNKFYDAAIKPVSRLTRLYNDVVDKFGLTKRTGEGLMPSDQTISSLKTLPAERRGISQGVMRRVKAATGQDFTGMSKTRQLADQFVGGNAQGTRRAFGGATIGSGVGAGIGALVGHPTAGAAIGSQIGTVAGMATDTSGRETAARIIDAYAKIHPWLEHVPYGVVARMVASGIIGNPESQGGQ